MDLELIDVISDVLTLTTILTIILTSVLILGFSLSWVISPRTGFPKLKTTNNKSIQTRKVCILCI